METKGWKIFINSGYKEEFEAISGLVFKTKKEAQEAARNGIATRSGKVYHYPMRCVVRV